jgi:hypothetical protein
MEVNMENLKSHFSYNLLMRSVVSEMLLIIDCYISNYVLENVQLRFINLCHTILTEGLFIIRFTSIKCADPYFYRDNFVSRLSSYEQ